MGVTKFAFFCTLVLNYHGINYIKQSAAFAEVQIFIYSIKVDVYRLDEQIS